MTNIPKPESIEEAQQLIRNQLMGLNPTGDLGFEGFMANVLSEFTERAFYVVKSGHQDGSDVRSAPHNLFKIGLEGKRYGDSNSLPLDNLLHKITDASTARVPVDLWLLATTRRIDASDRERLHAHGEGVGIGIVVLDCPRHPAQLCELMVICASAPKACKSFLNSSEFLSEALELIQNDSDFRQLQSQILCRLLSADIGYESTRLVIERWMVEAQNSLTSAKSRLGGHHDLGMSEYGVIPRDTLNAKLDDWYAGDNGAAVLLGDEGTGKSWVMLDWYNRLSSSETGAPLTIFLSAKSIESDVKKNLVKALTVQTEIRSLTFWEKRLAHWEHCAGNRGQILILIDGLNENFTFTRWAEWLQPLFENQIGCMYRVILTCWPNWWYGSLASLVDLVPNPQQIEVDGFNDSELNALLAKMEVNRSDFASAVLELMRVPRLSSLVAKYREKLKRSGDITAERVIYEDWKDRLIRRGSMVGLTDPEMKEFVAKLGCKLKGDIDRAVTRREIVESLSNESGRTSLELKPAVTELTSGAWLVPGKNPNSFRVARGRIPFVLGATLMSEIRKDSEASAIESMIAEFLDPLKAHSLGAAILRAATTIALIEDDSLPVLRKTLLSRWLDEQNFHTSDFEAFWRLAGLDPELFFKFAELRWLARTSGSFNDEVLIKAFANAAEFSSEYKRVLEERMTNWLANVWPVPKLGAGIDRVQLTESDSTWCASETLEIHAEWGSCKAAKYFTSITYDNNKNWGWLGQRALAIISYLERAPFVRVFEAWALSRAIMRSPENEREVAWILRLNPNDTDKASKSIGVLIRRLKAQDNSICDKAVVYLEKAMSHVKRASSLLEVNSEPEDIPTPLDVTCMDTSALYESAKNYLFPFAWKQIEPKSSAVLINTLIKHGFDNNKESLGLLLENLRDHLIVLTPDSRKCLQKIIATELSAINDDSDEGKRTTGKLNSAQLTMNIYDADPAEQSALVLSHGIGAELDRWLPFCRQITCTDIARTNLQIVPVSHVAGWLVYLGERLSKEEIAKLDFLPDLIAHANQDVRYYALILATHGCNQPALEVYAQSPYSEPQIGEDGATFRYEFWRNRALLEYCAYSPDISMSKRLSPEHVALIAKHKPTDSQLHRFNDYLRGEFEAIRSENSWSRPRYWSSYKEAVTALVEFDLDAVLRWMKPWIEKPSFKDSRGLMNDFPIIDSMQALVANAPKVSLKLYQTLIDSSGSSLFSSDGILYFPFELPESKCTINLCDKLLSEARTDKSLLEIAYWAYRNNQLDWLFDTICRLEESKTPADVARAYTLLGFCDECSRADDVWQDFLARPPSDRWLNIVIRSSFNEYERNRAARIALTEFWSNNKIWEARHALKRVEEWCDLRIGIWIKDIRANWNNPSYNHRLAIELARASLNQAIKEDKESRKKKLFHTPIANSTMAPWN